MNATLLQGTEAERRRAQRIGDALAAGERGVPQLLRFLDDPSWAVRRLAVSSLASLGPVAAPALCDLLLHHRDSEVRLAAAVEALAAASGAVEGEVLALGESEKPPVLCDAAQILGRRRSASARPLLIRLISHPNDNVAVAAIEALGRVGGGEAVEALLQLVAKRQFFRAFPALDVLGRSGDPRVVAPLAALINDPLLGTEAIRALGHTASEAALLHLLTTLGHDRPLNDRAVAEAICEIHDTLRQRTGNGEPAERLVAEAGRHLKRLGTLTHGFATATEDEQRALSRVLAWIGTDEAIEALLAVVEIAPGPTSDALAGAGRLDQPQILDAMKRGSAARRSLLPLLRGRAETVEELLSCLDDPDPVVRILACDALARSTRPEAVGTLFAHLDDPDLGVAQAVVGAIQALGGNDTERLALEAARSEKPAVRRAALRILAYFGFRAGLRPLLTAAREGDERSRELAIAGLPLYDEAEALDAVLVCGAAPQSKMRAAAMRALGQRAPDERTSEALLAGLRDADPWVRYYACQSLGRRKEERAATAIEGLLTDAAGQVQVAAVEALSHLEGPGSLAALKRASDSSDLDVRRAAVLGLGLRGSRDSLPLLLAATRAPESATRLVSLAAIERFEQPEVLPVLLDLARDPDLAVSKAALAALGKRSGVAVARGLVSLLGVESIREQVVALLARPVPGRLAVLGAALPAASEELAPVLSAALFQMRVPEAADALVAALYFGGSPARRASASLLRWLPSADAEQALGLAATQDPDVEVRRICAAARSQR